MQKIVVSRNDDLYEGFADIARAADGTLVCTYRESLRHGPLPFSRMVVRRSGDGGLTWGPTQLVFERTREETAAGEGVLNCPRLAACADGTLLLVVDLMYKDQLQPDPAMNLLFRSRDHGATWEGPCETGITAGIVPALKELSTGELLLGVTELRTSDGQLSGLEEQQTVYRSVDQGRTWEGPFGVPLPEEAPAGGGRWRFSEGDFAELDDGAILVYMREDGEGLSGWKSLSTDGGRTWSSPYRTQMRSCVGRPSVGRLRSGEIAITYRFGSGVSTALGLYVETPWEARRFAPLDPNNYKTEYARCRFAFLDNDRAACPDGGYSGWVQLPEGDLYVVNYITDDAPRAQIRGYIVGRQDWYLFPEGEIYWYFPADEGEYIQRAQEVSRAQYSRVQQQTGRARVPTQK